MKQQAELVYEIMGRTIMVDGSTAGSTTLLITAEQSNALRSLASRLDRMAPFEERIRKMVVGQ